MFRYKPHAVSDTCLQVILKNEACLCAYEYAGLAERSQAMKKDECNAADGRLGRKTRPKRDRQPTLMSK